MLPSTQGTTVFEGSLIFRTLNIFVPRIPATFARQCEPVKEYPARTLINDEYTSGGQDWTIIRLTFAHWKAHDMTHDGLSIARAYGCKKTARHVSTLPV